MYVCFQIRFNFTAIMIGSTDLTFTVTDTNTQTNTTLDSLTVRVPVLAPRAPVFVGTSFALRGAGGSAAGDASNGSVTWQEGLELPKALQGSGGINILAGVGYLPAVIASTNAVAARQALDRYVLEGQHWHLERHVMKLCTWQVLVARLAGSAPINMSDPCNLVACRLCV